MYKKKRTDDTVIVDIAGCNQPDQELTIEFDRERCIWNLKKWKRNYRNSRQIRLWKR